MKSEIIRSEQQLDEDMDYSLKEYKMSAQLHLDFRHMDSYFNVHCDYDFLNSISVGDELFITNEDTGNLSPLVISVELDDNNYRNKILKVTRKIYSPTSLDVYVLPTDN